MIKKQRIYCFLACALCTVFLPIKMQISSKKIYAAEAASAWVEAQAECVVEAESRRILYASRSETKLPMASTTKIVTAISVLDTCADISQNVSVPQEAEGVEGSSVYLKAGDNYSIEELLYGLLLRSGNDCAVALATHVSGSVEKFSALMNQTAKRAGALDSHFTNPHGLPAKGHYTTAKDLSLIACYAMQNPIFKSIVSTKYFAPRNWKNKNKMLTVYEGGIGIKTGYTKEAGRCLVSAAERNAMTLICTVLNCPTTYERSAKLLDDAFAAYQNVCILSDTQKLEVVSGKEKICAHADKSYYYPLLQEEKPLIEIKTRPYEKRIKNKNGKEIVGQFEIYLSKRLLFSGNLYKL